MENFRDKFESVGNKPKLAYKIRLILNKTSFLKTEKVKTFCFFQPWPLTLPLFKLTFETNPTEQWAFHLKITLESGKVMLFYCEKGKLGNEAFVTKKPSWDWFENRYRVKFSTLTRWSEKSNKRPKREYLKSLQIFNKNFHKWRNKKKIS